MGATELVIQPGVTLPVYTEDAKQSTPSTIPATVKQLASVETLDNTIKALTWTRYGEEVVKGIAGVSYENNHTSVLKFTGPFTGALALQTIKENVKESFDGTATRNEKINNAANAGYAVGVLTDGISHTVEFLETVGAIGKVSSTAMFPIAFASTPIEFVALGLSTKYLVETHQLASKIEKIETAAEVTPDPVLVEYRKVRDLLLDQKLGNEADKTKADRHFFKKSLHSEEPEIAHRLMVLEANAEKKLQSDNPEEVKKAQETLKKTIVAIKKRIDAKKWTHRLEMLVSSVYIVALFIFFFTPLAPLACGLLILGGVGSLAITYLQKKRAEEQFRKALFNEE